MLLWTYNNFIITDFLIKLSMLAVTSYQANQQFQSDYVLYSKVHEAYEFNVEIKLLLTGQINE